MMKYADLQPPELDLLAGQPLWSMVPSTVSSTNRVSEPPRMSAMAMFHPNTNNTEKRDGSPLFCV